MAARIAQHRLRSPLFVVVVLMMLAALALVWSLSPLAEHASPEKLAAFMAELRDNPLAPLLMIGVFIVSGLLFFPLVIVMIATAMTFGPLEGIFISLSGALCSGAVSYTIGHLVGRKRFRSAMGPIAERIRRYAADIGVAGMTVIHFLPIAPFSVVNMGIGALHVPFPIFVTGIFLALLPGAIIRSFLGDAIVRLWHNPDAQSILYISAGLLAWLVVVILTHRFAQRWRRKHGH
jgi:phospholipase D1/2